MARNGAGVQTSPGASYPAVATTLIESAKFNAVIDDINSVLTSSVASDGQTPMTGNLNMGNNKQTTLLNGSARTDSISLGQVQDGVLNWVAATGTADAITGTYSPAITALIDGQVLGIRAAGANTLTNPTFSPNGLTARTITRNGGAALLAGSIAGAGFEFQIKYNLANTRWELLNQSSTAVSPTVIVASAASTAIGAAVSENVDISGTTTITSFDTVAEGINRKGRFTGALILTHNATLLILPGVANITTAANDRYEARSLGGGNWIVTKYVYANGNAISATNATSATNLTGSGTVSATTTGGAGLVPTNAINATNATNVTGSAVVTGAVSSSSPTTGIGYATGAGGSVNQITSNTTSVTLNNRCGLINIVSTSVSANTTYTFVFFNSTIQTGDVVIVNNETLDGFCWANQASVGSCFISMRYFSAVTVAEKIRFAVIKAVIV